MSIMWTDVNRRPVEPRRGAFTLIEVLVVVAIIALLVAILLPSLARAREQSKMMICQGHLKELGTAIAMYTLESKDSLPGPQHPAMLKSVSDPPPLTPFIQKHYLPRMLRRYMSESGCGSGSMADAIATCPSFPAKDDEFDAVVGRPFHYAVNTWVYTAPNYYFGFTHGGIQSYEQWVSTYGDTAERLARYSPKKVSRIEELSREWAIADAFQKPNDSSLVGLGHGSWPREDYAGADSGIPLPKSPFHMGVGYKLEGPRWVYRGRTPTLYLDMHAEAQRGWKGTVNPSPDN